MPTTYYLDDTSAGAYPAFAGDDKYLLDTAVDTASTHSTGTIATGGLHRDNFSTPTGDPGASGTNTGTFTVEVNVTAADSNIDLSVDIHRVDSGGTDAGVAGLTSGGSSAVTLGATGLLTWTVTNPVLGTWATGDRFVVQLIFTNTSMHATATASYTIRSADAEVITPWGAATNTKTYTLQSYTKDTDQKQYTIQSYIQETFTKTHSVDAYINPVSKSHSIDSIIAFNVSYTFNGGSDETTITTSDTGSGDQFFAITNAAAGSEVVYDSAWSKSGQFSGRFTGGTGGGGFARWEWDNTTGGTTYFRGYFRGPSSAPAANLNILQPALDGTAAGAVRIDATTGVLRVIDSTFSGPSSPSTFAFEGNNEVIRIELKTTHDTTSGSMEARLFYGANIDGDTPDETLSISGKNTLSGYDAMRIGMISSSGPSVWWDEVAWTNVTWIGPLSTSGALQLPLLLNMGGAAPSYTTKTHSVDSLFSATLSKTQSIDSLLQMSFTETHSVDSSIKATLSETYSIESLLTASMSKTHSVDSLTKATLSKTHSVDSLTKATLSKTHSVDSLNKAALLKTHSLDTRIVTAAGLVYDDTYAAHGTQSAKVWTGTDAGTSYVEWTGLSISGSTVLYSRIYLYFTALESSDNAVIRYLDGTTSKAGVEITSGGNIRIFDSTGTKDTSTATIPTNQWFRIEFSTDANASTAAMSASLYSTMDSTTPTETISSSTGNTGTQFTAVRFGITSSVADYGPIWMDDLAVDTSSIGPYTKTKTHSLDGLTSVRFTKTHSIDSVIGEAATITHSVDSLTEATLTKTHAVDSLTTASFTETHDVDSLIRATLSKTLLVDSLTRATLSKTHSSDSLIEATLSKSHSIDSLTEATMSEAHVIESLIQATILETHDIDSLTKASLLKTHSVDSLMKATLSETHLVDSLMKATLSETHGVDSELQATQTLTKTYSIDSLTKAVLEKTYATDSLINITSTESYVVESLIQASLTESHVIDSLIQATISNTYSLESLIKATSSETHTTDSLIKASLIKTHALDSITKTTSSKTHSLDSSLEKTLVVTHALDLLTRESFSVSTSLDSLISFTYDISHQIDTLQRKTITVSTALSSVLFSGTQVFYQVESLTQKTFDVQGDIDGLVEKQFAVSGQIDASLSSRVSSTTSIDAKLSSQIRYNSFEGGVDDQLITVGTSGGDSGDPFEVVF